MKIKAKIGIIILNILVLSGPAFSLADATTTSDFAAGTYTPTVAQQAPPNSADSLKFNQQQTPAPVDLGKDVQANLSGLSQSQDPTVQSASQASFHITPDCATKSVGFSNGRSVPVENCGWNDLVTLAKNIMVYLIFIGTTLAAISVAYAGFMYATSAGNSGKIEKAHQIFTMVAVGVLFLWGGWLLVATIMKTLGVDNAFSLVNNSSVVPVNPTTTK